MAADIGPAVFDEPLSGQRALSVRARSALFPVAPGFGVETRMSIDAGRAGLQVAEIELDLAHRPTGRDPSGALHRARQLHPDMVQAADLVLVMEAGHKRAIDDADPTARGKVYRLGEWQDRDIDDPYRQPRAAYEEALEDIEAGVASWAERIRA